MTAVALNLPIAAGGAVLEFTGSAIHWGFARYMRAPLANTAILAMLTLTSMAASNALYNQRLDHPSPLFTPFQRVVAPEPEPVIPADRPERPALSRLVAPVVETTGSVAPTPVLTLGNAEVTEIQRKLHSMQIYEGAIDGLYGPRTARAIKAFEQRAGLAPKGELTVALLEAVRGASVIAPEPKVEPLPTPDPLPAVTLPKVQAAPLTAAVAPVEQPAPTELRATAPAPVAEKVLSPLATPAPLAADVEKRSLAPQKPVLRREIPETPEQAMELVAKTAGEAIDTIIDGVQTVTMTTPGKKKSADQASPQPATAAAAPARLVEASLAPQIGVPLQVEEPAPTQSSADVVVLDTDAKVEELAAFSVTDPETVAKVQRGLASLGFLQGAADGVPGEATATAIRRFEVWYNYEVTGRITPELLDLLVANGAVL
jgi:peptidoglycan hydrolase-like protein with peptidoglycan-binding domain